MMKMISSEWINSENHKKRLKSENILQKFFKNYFVYKKSVFFNLINL